VGLAALLADKTQRCWSRLRGIHDRIEQVPDGLAHPYDLSQLWRVNTYRGSGRKAEAILMDADPASQAVDGTELVDKNASDIVP
jgi:hypothetical protein